MTSWRVIGVIAVHQLRRVALDGAIVWLIALPLLIMYVLGVTLQPLFVSGFVPEEPFPIVVAADKSAATADIVGTLEAMPEYFVVELATNEEAARRFVLERKSDAAVIVPPAFPEQRLSVVAAPGDIAGDIVADVLEAVAWGDETASGNTANSAMSRDETKSMPWLQVGAFEYFSVGITVMFTMFAAHSSMVYFVGDRVTDVYARTRTLGVSRGTYLAAGFASAVLIGIVFIAVMSGMTTVLFGIKWGAIDGWLTLTISGAAGLSAISFFLMAILPPDPKSVENAGSVVYVMLAFLGGSTVPLAALPEWFRNSLAWLPNRTLLDGYLELAAGGALSDVAQHVRTNALAAVVLFVLAWSVVSVRTKGEA